MISSLFYQPNLSRPYFFFMLLGLLKVWDNTLQMVFVIVFSFHYVFAKIVNPNQAGPMYLTIYTAPCHHFT